MTDMACHQCDLVQRIPPLPKWSTAHCCRCGTPLLRNKPDTVDRTLALLSAGLILFALACTFPFLALRSGAIIQETTLVTGVIALYKQGMIGLSILVTLTCVLIPLAQMLALLYVLLPLKLNRSVPAAGQVFRCYRSLQPWGMLEVFMLGILVALVKLADLATIIPGIALFAFVLLVIVLTAMLSLLEPQQVWQRLGAQQ